MNSLTHHRQLTVIDKVWLAAPAAIGICVLIVHLILHGAEVIFIGGIALFWGLVASAVSTWLFRHLRTRAASYFVTSLVGLAGYGLAWISFLIFANATGFYI